MSMTDKELLERAARAAGLELVLWQQDGTPHASRPNGTVSERWNPLTDDGEALRLAAKLMLHIEWWPACGSGVVAACTDTVKHSEPWRDDRTAAMRRAIVRAAAEMGQR